MSAASLGDQVVQAFLEDREDLGASVPDLPVFQESALGLPEVRLPWAVQHQLVLQGDLVVDSGAAEDSAEAEVAAGSVRPVPDVAARRHCLAWHDWRGSGPIEFASA
jgi:hypothetical protein